MYWRSDAVCTSRYKARGGKGGRGWGRGLQHFQGASLETQKVIILVIVHH